jgi:hypothetical protein
MYIYACVGFAVSMYNYQHPPKQSHQRAVKAPGVLVSQLGSGIEMHALLPGYQEKGPWMAFICSLSLLFCTYVSFTFSSAHKLNNNHHPLGIGITLAGGCQRSIYVGMKDA